MLAFLVSLVVMAIGSYSEDGPVPFNVFIVLVGLLFRAPWLGLAIGALSGAITGRFSDIDIEDKFIRKVGNTREPGHSALFLLVYDVTPDKVIEDLKQLDGTVLRTSLSSEDEAKLKEAFAAHEVEG